jgi:tRNA(Ile)-lysidine synthase
VSGGADSLALLLLAHELAQKKGSHVVALTVDHGLRPESKKEAHQVKKWANDRGMQHVTLEWGGEKPLSRLQEKARVMRYQLLLNWCKQHHISTLLLGHHQQDQEETFWLRLSAGSGLDGLVGMKKSTLREGITCLRPLLNFSKERLQATLWAQNQEWIEDPSNHKPHFFRGRLRMFLQEEGFDSSRLHRVMTKFQTDKDFIHQVLQTTLQAIVEVHEGGYLTVQKKAFEELHPAITHRLLAALVQWFSNKDYAPRHAQVLTIMENLQKGLSFTSGGIYWTFSREHIRLYREKRAVAPKIPLSTLQENTLWDQRFWIDPYLKHHVPPTVEIGSLADTRLKTKKINSLIPKYVLSTLPALWAEGKVVAVPHLCYSAFECGEELQKFISAKPLFTIR